MIAFQTLAKMVAPALTVSIHILVRAPRDLMEATVKTVSKISSIAVSSFVNARVKGHLKPTHLKSSPLFTFSTKSLGQDSPSIHLFSKIIGSRFTFAKIKLGEDSPS